MQRRTTYHPIKTDVSLTFDVDVDEVLNALSDEDLAAALERRDRRKGNNVTRLTLIYEEFVRRGDAPRILKDFLYDTIGRIL